MKKRALSRNNWPGGIVSLFNPNQEANIFRGNVLKLGISHVW